MKHLNFLSKSGSQSMGLRVTTLALTVGSPSAHRRGAMLKLISVLVLILTIGVGQMWGDSDSKTVTYSEKSISNSTSVDGTSYALGDYFTVTITKNGAGTAPTYYDSGSAVRCYVTKNTSNGNIITVSRNSDGAAVNAYITSVTYSGTHSKKGTTSFTYSGTTSSTTATSASYAESSKVTSASATLKETGNSANGQFYLTGVTVAYVYTPAAPSYSITAQSNNTNYGTVSLSSSVITGSPKSGYRYASPAYTVTSGTATVSQSGNAFTVNPSTNCTVTINFEPIPTHKISFNTGGLVNIADATGIKEGDTYSITQTPAASLTANCEYGTFVGWTTASSIASASVCPTIITSYEMQDADVTLHAVYSKTVGGTGAAVGVTMFSEAWTGATNNTQPSSPTANGSSVYGGATISYTWHTPTDGSTSQTYNSGGPNSNDNILVSKKSGYWKVSGIPTGKASTLTLSYATSGSGSISVSTETQNVSISNNTITINSSNVTSFDLKFTNSNNSNNVRLDDISVIVASTSNAGTTTYSLDANCCQPLGSINGSISVTTPPTQNSVTIEWDNVSGASNWAVACKQGGSAYAGAQVGNITGIANNRKQCTISNLAAGTEYTFTISADLTGYCTSSYSEDVVGSTAAAFEITAQSNNTNYGTVLLSGTTITATLADYCRYATAGAYTVIEGTATVSQNGNEFTVTPSTDCTVRINFEPIPVTGVTMSSNAETLEVGGTVVLTATVNPNTVNPNVTWTSSDPTVATVSNGTVTATQKAGTTTITATSVGDNTKSATCTVTVVPVTEYKKVTAALTDWSGEYLLVYEHNENTAYVYTGVDAASNYASTTISNDKIKKPANGAKLTIASMTGGYSVQLTCNNESNNGKYLAAATNGNGTTFNADAQANTISYANNAVQIQNTNGNNTATIKYNSAQNNYRFRYFGSGQQSVQLYRKVVTSAVTITAPATGTGTLTLADGQTPVVSGANVDAGTQLTVTATPNSGNHYIGGTVTVTKTVGGDDVTAAVYSNGTITMPEYAITVSASFTPTYAITKVADGGSIALSYTQGDAEEGYATAGTSVTATATADGSHVFTSISLSNNVENPSISANVAIFTMPASAVTVTAEFAVKQDPSIVVTDGTNPITALNFGSVAKTSDPVAQTFKLSGLNLAQGTLTIASSDDTKFTVSPTSINVEGTLEETTVTVTPVTSVAGTFNDEFIMISGGGLAQADEVMIGLSLTVQETYTAKWYVNGAEQLGSTVTGIAGTALTFPDAPTPTGNCAGTEFKGWLTAPLAEASADEPDDLIKTYTGHTMPAANVNYYAVFAEETPGEEVEDTYSHTIEEKTWSSAGAQTLGSVAWTLAYDGNYYGSDGTKGQQVGSGSDPASEMSLTTSGISGKITSVKIYTSGAKDVEATVAASVNGVAYKNNNSTSPVAISTTNTGYEFTGSETGEIVISWAQTSSKALYFKQIEVRYAVPGASTYSNYVTTCVACSNVSLVEAGETNGTITLKQGTKEVSSVKTCNGAVTLTTNAVAETGYELTNIALSGVANATVNQEMTEITIPQDAEGTLTVTATFAQKNYSIAVETYPENIGATLCGATSTAKYGVVQTISTDEPTGYIFGGWYIYDAEDTEKETDLSEEIFTGTYEGQELELSASFLMPDKNLVAVAYFDKIHTVSEFNALSKEDGTYYVIEGLICNVESYSNSKYITYDISDNGVNSGTTLKIYKGLGLNGASFSAATDLKVGERVRVYGAWDNSHTDINQDSKLYYHQTLSVASVAISGTASKTAYSSEDNTFSFAGLTATATYNTGYVKDVTSEATWKANSVTSYTVTETENVSVTATLSDVTSEPKVVAVTYTTKTVASIRLEYASTYTFKGFELPKPRVYASYVEDIPEEEVTEFLTDANYDTKSVYDKDVADNYTITVEYKSKETTYSVTVKAIYNTQETAHSVADAIEIIKKSTYTSTSADPTAMYVHGVVCEVGSINNGKLGYYINDTESTDGQLQVYQGLYFGSESFTNDNILAVGDEVIIEGHMLYFSSTTPELKLSPLVYLLKKALPTISVENVDELEVGQADLDITELITKQGNGVVSLESGDLEKLTVDGLTLHAVEAGDVTVTANLAATDNTGSINYKANSTTFNVHVIAARTRYTVTFDANGADGGSAPEAIANQLEGAPVTLPECSYSWAKHGFTGWTVINLSTSAEIEIENNQFTMPAANVKIQAQWKEIATTHIVFNVNGNTETVAAVDVPQEVEYSITQVTDGQNGYEFFGWAESPETEDVEEAIATIESYTPEVGENSKTLYAVFKRVDEGAPKTDVLTAADFAATSTTYTDFSNVSKTSDAKYAGNSAKDNAGAIQMRSDNSNSGIVSTTTGGVLKSVTINVASGSKTIDVYGSNTAYSAASDLYATGNNANQGTKIGSTSSTATINAVADYKYVGIRSNSGAIYLSRVEIVWQPKTTYYTTAPSAVYAVSYALGEGGAWQEDEGCDGANVKAGQTFDICESVPVRDGYKFVKWQIGGEDAASTITINANTTITAVWIAKPQNNLTYNAGTGTGSNVIVSNVEEGTVVTLKAIGSSEGQANFTKDGYNFVGWLRGDVLYKAGETFEMPASAITFVAQWKKENITKMTLVTDVAQLVDGSKVVIVSKDPVSNSQTKSSAIAGPMSGNNKFFASVTEGLTFNNDNTISYNAETAIELTLDKVEGGWALRSGDNYLAHVSGQNQVKWQSEKAVWNISFSGNNATIKFSDNYSIQYNAASNSERFSAYSGSQNAVQLYASVTAVTENASISELGYVEGDVIVVSSGATLTMDAPSAPASITVKENAVVNVTEAVEAGTVIVEKGAKLDIEEGGSVTTNEPLVLYTTLGKGTGTTASGNAPGSSSEIINAERLNATGDVYLEIELTQDAKASAGWYAFSVPFPVDAMNGVYYGNTKLTNEVGYAIMSYHGDVRAQGLYGWKKYREIMQPGVLYIITVGDTDYKKLRFKKVAGADLAASNSVTLKKYASETNTDAGWNGIGNPNLQVSNYATGGGSPTGAYIQFLDHSANTFKNRQRNNVNLVVGSAFFFQYTGDNEQTSITINTGAQAGEGNGYLAPKRERNAAEETIYEVELTNVATEEIEDNIFLTAREEATNEYEIGRDVAKMSMGTAKCAQMWVPAYGTQLCAADFPLVNDKATYPLTINAPSAGTYTISAAETSENATLYLTKNGRIYWNLTMGACELDLAQGQNNEYGLVLRAEVPAVTTGIENGELLNGENGVQKVVIDEHVFILRGGEMYDMTGKMVK